MKTKCIRGHKFTANNSYILPDGKRCRTCYRIRQAALRKKNKLLIDTLTARVALLEEALGFYAEESNYYVNGAVHLQNHISDTDLESKYGFIFGLGGAIREIGGKRARTALQRSKELGG